MTGTEIRNRREKLHLSQAQFAAQIGVSIRTLQNWEQDHRQPRVAGLLERAIAALESAQDGPPELPSDTAPTPLTSIRQ